MEMCCVVIFVFIVYQSIGVSSGSEYTVSDQRPLPIITSDLFATEIVTELTNITLDHCNINIVDENAFRGMSNLRYLSIFNNSIENVDVGLFKDNLKLESIVLCANKIPKLENGIFTKLVAVTAISLCNNSIESIEDGVFGDMPALEMLSLSGNRIVTLNTNIFSNNKQLQTLKLAFNSIEYLNESIFHNLNQLKTIYLYSNRITAINERLFSNSPYLEFLHLGRNAIQKIDDGTFVHNINLKILWLNRNQISYIGDHVFPNISTNHLTELHLQHNCITVIRKELFANLVRLEILSLSNNDIKKIDDGTLEHNTNLKILWLRNNQILYIGMHAFPNQLTKLYLQNISMIAIEKGVLSNLVHLEVLELSNNNLQKLEDGIFEYNTNLKILWLNDNKIHYIGKHAFPNTTTNLLKELYLKNNSITAVNSELFLNFPHLEILSLNNNAIKKIDDGTFEHNTYLKILWLNDNKIFYIGKNAFPNNISLQKILINNNNLVYLDGSLVDHLKGLSDLALYNNPWFCDCRLVELYNIWQSHRKYIKPYCTGPNKFRSVTWDRILPRDLCPNCSLWNDTHVNDTVNVNIGENVNLTCTLCAQKVRWLYRSDTGLGDSDTLHSPRYTILTEVKGLSITSKLTITRASIEDGGRYTCQAVGTGELHKMHFQLIIIISETSTVNFYLIVGFGLLAVLTFMTFVRITVFVNLKCTSESEPYEIPLRTLRMFEARRVTDSVRSSTEEHGYSSN